MNFRGRIKDYNKEEVTHGVVEVDSHLGGLETATDFPLHFLDIKIMHSEVYIYRPEIRFIIMSIDVRFC